MALAIPRGCSPPLPPGRDGTSRITRTIGAPGEGERLSTIETVGPGDSHYLRMIGIGAVNEDTLFGRVLPGAKSTTGRLDEVIQRVLDFPREVGPLGAEELVGSGH